MTYSLSDPAAHAGEVKTVAETSPYLGKAERPSIFMVGDSITWYGIDWMRRRGFAGEISAIPGRDVSTLPYYCYDRMNSGAPAPKAVILALGTNATPGWYEANYQACVDMFPSSTWVYFVNTYRDPIKWPNTVDYRRRAIIQTHYSTFMYNIAKAEYRTGLVDWRGYISVRPNLLRDGVHPTDEGSRAWSYLITQKLDNIGIDYKTTN